jgi:hypothetical protein
VSQLDYLVIGQFARALALERGDIQLDPFDEEARDAR